MAEDFCFFLSKLRIEQAHRSKREANMPMFIYSCSPANRSVYHAHSGQASRQ